MQNPPSPTPTAKQIREAQQAVKTLRKVMRTGFVVSDAAREFLATLDSSKTEQDITPTIKARPGMLGRLADARYPHVFQALPVGIRHPDFVVLDSFSGGWDVTMIELEPPTATLFTKGGNPAKRLAGAIKQVDDWRDYVKKHRQEVLTRLSEYYMEKDLIGGVKHAEPIDCTGIPLADVRSSVMWSYLIVIGRRKKLTTDETRRKAGYFDTHGIRIATYDRLVEVLDRMEVFPLH